MTIETETILIKLLEELKADVKATNLILTNVQVSLAKLEEKTISLQQGQDILTEDVKEAKNDIKGRVSIQVYWFFVLFSVLIGIIGKFAFFPSGNP